MESIGVRISIALFGQPAGQERERSQDRKVTEILTGSHMNKLTLYGKNDMILVYESAKQTKVCDAKL